MEISDHPHRNFKIHIIAFLCLSICIAAAGWIFYTREKAYSEKTAGQTLSAIADLKISQIVNWRKERLGNASVISVNPFNNRRIREFLENPSSGDSGDDIRAWMESLQKNYAYQNVLITDTQGKIRLSVGFDKEHKDSQSEISILEVIRTKKPIMSDFHRSETTGLIHLEMYTPLIIEPESRVFGVLIHRIDPNQFLYPMIQSWPTPSPSAETLLIRRNSHNVIFLNELRHQKNTALSLRLPITDKELPASGAVLGVEGIVEGIDYRGVPVLAAIRKIPDTNWAMSAKVDKEEIFAPMFARIRIIWAAGTVLILLMGVFFLFQWKKREAEFYLQEIQERKRAEESLKNSEEKFRSYIDNSPDGVFVADENGRYLEVNRSASMITGYSVSELLSMSIPDLAPPDSLETALNHFQTMKKTGYASSELEFIHKNSTKRWWSVDAVRLTETRFLGFVKDITERKRANNALRINEQRYRKAQEMGHVGNWEYNLKTGLFWGSDEAKRIYGFDPEQTDLSTDEVEACIPEREKIHQALVDLIEHEKEYRLEFEIRPKNSTDSKFISSLAELHRDENGNPLALLGVILDITERKLISDFQSFLVEYDYLRAGEDFFMALAQQIAETLKADFVCIDTLEDENLSAKTLAVWFDGKFEDNLSYALKDTPCGDVVGKTICSFTEGVRHKFPKDEVLQEMTAEGYMGTTLRDSQGQSIGLIALIWRTPLSSVTLAEAILKMASVRAAGELERRLIEEERRNLEDQLRQAQKMEAVGQLAGGVAHDFNNLLYVITGYADMMLEDLPPNSVLHNNMKEILQAAQRATTLVRQLLLFSRREAMLMKVLNLNDLISELIKMVRRVIGEHIPLEFLPGVELMNNSADPGQLEQVLMNLCVNARDAMPDGGRIVIETQNISLDAEYCKYNTWAKEGEYVLLTVSDTGSGIPHEIQDHIFEPFFTTKEVGKGTGLGLAAVYGIVRSHQGMIRVYSEPGQGTAFKIYLPATQNRHASLNDEKESAAPLSGGQETILVAEDEESVRTMIVHILKKVGYRVLSAKDGEEAISLFETHSSEIDIALLDVIMPKIGGQKVYERIRSSSDMPVIFSSGYSRGALSFQAFPNEQFDILQKPVSPTALLRKIREVLDYST